MSIVGNIQDVVTEIGKDTSFILQSLYRKLDDAEGSIKSKHMGAKPPRTVLANLGDGRELPTWSGMPALREALGFAKSGQTFFTSAEDLQGDYGTASNLVVHDPDSESRVEVLSAASASAASVFFGKIAASSVAALRYYTNTESMDIVLPTGSALRISELTVSGSAVKDTGSLLTDGTFSVSNQLAQNLIGDIDAVRPTGIYGTSDSTTGVMPPGTPGWGIVINYRYNVNSVTQLFKSNFGTTEDTMFMRQRTNAGVWEAWSKIGGGRTERGTLNTSDVSGTTYTFTKPFNTVPQVSVICEDGTSLCTATISAPSLTGVEVHTWDGTGARMNSTVHVIAVGD